ncbi:MAG: TonB-dependent receptor domain-containing protein [Saccharospirillum sp.]
MNHSKTIALLLVGVALPFAFASAQSELDTIVVTASRSEQPLTTTIAPVTVISRDDIERSGYQSVDEVLHSVPGVTLSNLGGRGQTQTLQMRGSPRSRHVLVLVDGVPLADPTSGIASLEFLSVSDIERIEVVRGPKSSLYGSDAMGGIIQIFTRNPDQEQTEVGLSVGSYGFVRTSVADTQALSERLWLRSGLSFEREDGFNVRSDAGDPDRDGYQLTSANLGLDYTVNADTELGLQWQFRTGQTEFDASGTTGNVTDYRYHQVQTHLRQHRDSSEAAYSLYYKSGERNNYHEGIGADEGDLFVDNQLGVSAQRTLYLNDTLDLTLGADTRLDDVTGSDVSYYPGNYQVTRRFTTGVFAGLAYYGERWRLDASGRLHNDDQYGEAVVGSLGARYDLTPHWVASLSWGTAYSVPTFDDLYSPFGNPELKPERSVTTEAGLDYEPDWGSVSLVGFQTDYSDRIGGFPLDNVDTATVRGLETSIEVTPTDNTIFSARYTGLDATDGDGDRLIRLPEHKVVIRGEQRLGWLRVGAEATTELGRLDSRFDPVTFEPETVELDDYQLASVYVNAVSAAGLRVTARVNNLFDEDYVHVLGYRTPGRNYTLSARYRF